MEQKRNRYDQFIENLKNNRIIVIILLLFSILVGVSKLLSSIVNLSDTFDPVSDYPEIIKVDSIEPEHVTLDLDYALLKDYPLNVIMFQSGENQNPRIYSELITELFPKSTITIQKDWSKKKYYKATTIIYIKSEFKKFADFLDEKIPKTQIVKKYIEGHPYYGLSKREIAIIIGDELN